MTHVLPRLALGAPDRYADCSECPASQQKAFNTRTTPEQTRIPKHRRMYRTETIIAAQEDSYLAPPTKAEEQHDNCKQDKTCLEQSTAVV